jgi:hypothetical protein
MEMTPQNSRLAADVNSNHYWMTIGHSIFSREDLRWIKYSGQQVLNNELRTVIGVVDSKSFLQRQTCSQRRRSACRPRGKAVTSYASQAKTVD